MPITILAIESSCDETSAAVISNKKMLSNIIATQTVHEKYGGVIPELASRAHQQNIVPVVQQAIDEAKIKKENISAVAFTQGPGLIGSLLVGSSFAKSFAQALNIPIIGINHMQAHVLAHFIGDNNPSFPFLCLTVSGGHTQIVLVKSFSEMKIVGETMDDAAGEAFDKASKILGLPYPGGPMLDILARDGNANAFQFPEPKVEGLNFSFSGLKTSFLYFIRDEKKKNEHFIQDRMNDICASIEQRIVSILINKISTAAKQFSINDIAIAGGVSANSCLRNELKKSGEKNGWKIFIPAMEYCTDNAAMIAMAAHFRYINKDFDTMEIVPSARLHF